MGNEQSNLDYSLTGELCVAVQSNQVDVVRALLTRRADVNATNFTSITPLHIEARKQHASLPMISLLLNHDADINARTIDGETALHYAASYNNHVLLMELLDRNADIDVVNNRQLTPLACAVLGCHQQLAMSLIARKANINIQCASNTCSMQSSKSHLQPSRARKSVVLTQPLLHAIAAKGLMPLTRVLVGRKADVNHRDQRGATPLHVAAERNHVDVVQCLLAHRAHVNVVDRAGSTALHFAARNKSHQMLMNLLEHGADLTIKTVVCRLIDSPRPKHAFCTLMNNNRSNTCVCVCVCVCVR
jgi:ankyrin repeat protein